MDGAIGGAYYMRTIPAPRCSRFDVQQNDTRTGVIRYGGTSAEPKDMPGSYPVECKDEQYDKLIPVVPWKIGKPSNFASDSQFDIGLQPTSGKPYVSSTETMQPLHALTLSSTP